MNLQTMLEELCLARLILVRRLVLKVVLVVAAEVVAGVVVADMKILTMILQMSLLPEMIFRISGILKSISEYRIRRLQYLMRAGYPAHRKLRSELSWSVTMVDIWAFPDHTTTNILP